MGIRSAEFIKSSAKLGQCPPPDMPEYAFTGRSNVGKSSLINMLTGNKKMAKTSARPGKTQLINHFLINNEWYLVDLPGYGYAKAPPYKRKELAKMINNYIDGRVNLYCLFLLIDIRHAPLKPDIEFLRMLGEGGVPFRIVYTKCDKLTPARVKSNIEKYMRELEGEWENLPEYFCTSSLSGTGKDEIVEFIEQINLDS